MHIFLLIFYALLCSYALVKMPFVRNSGIRGWWLVLLFAFHVCTGWLHNWIAWRYYPEHGDVWNDFRLSFLYLDRLRHHFDLFISDNNTWTHFSHNSVVYVNMLLDILSRGHLDINTLLFAFPVFLGSIALYRTFRRRFPGDPLTAYSALLLPSVLFWTACLFREGLLYMLLGFMLYYLDQLPASATLRTRRLIRPIILFFLIAYVRPAVALALVPAIFIWWFMDKPKARRPLLLAATTLIALVIIGFNIPQAITARQNEFYQLEGHSRLWLPALDGTWHSILKALPAAALNGLFEPLPGSGGQLIYLAFSAELLLIWAIVLISPLRRRRQIFSPFNTFCLTFALTGMLTIGLIIPFAGAIVRYRSIYLPFLLAPFLHSLRLRLPFFPRRG